MQNVITGCSCGGKTTLIKSLESSGYQISEEPGRDIVREARVSGADILPWDNPIGFAKRCIEVSIQRYEAAVRCDQPVFFDRSLVDSVSALCFLDPGNSKRHRKLLDTYRYATTVFIVPPWPEIFELDAERQHSFAEAVAECNRLERTYSSAKYVLVEVPQVPVKQRVGFILNQLTKGRDDTA